MIFGIMYCNEGQCKSTQLPENNMVDRAFSFMAILFYLGCQFHVGLWQPLEGQPLKGLGYEGYRRWDGLNEGLASARLKWRR